MGGKHEKALAFMIEAIEMAANENLIAYFLFDLHYTRDLLNEVFNIQDTAKTKIHEKFIKNLKQAIGKKQNPGKSGLLTNLSEREMETLKLLPFDLSNQQIADKLFISLNTVKTHLKNIYLKLEVDNRQKAVREAKKNGLL